jgi:hypothetical protein
MKTILIFSIAILPTLINARSWKRYDSRVIEADFVSMVDPSTVKIRLHSTGKLFDYPIKNLSTDDRKFLEPFIKKSQENEKFRNELIRNLKHKAKYTEFKILQIVKDGMLVNDLKVIYTPGRSSSLGSVGGGGGVGGGGSYKTAGDKLYFIMHYPKETLVDGDHISGYFADYGTYSYTTVQGTQKTIRKLAFLIHKK